MLQAPVKVFLFNGDYKSFDYPGAIFTEATGINPGGVIVGLYTDSAAVTHGLTFSQLSGAKEQVNRSCSSCEDSRANHGAAFVEQC